MAGPFFSFLRSSISFFSSSRSCLRCSSSAQEDDASGRLAEPDRLHPCPVRLDLGRSRAGDQDGRLRRAG